MPGAGKSTVGVLLAKTLLMDFTDTDLLIQKDAKKALCDIINEKGTEYFIRLEEEVILKQTFSNSVIATGGSAVYGEKAMKSLREGSVTVYLKVSLPELIKNVVIFAAVVGVAAVYKKLKKKKISPILLIVISGVLGLALFSF
jgi:shikimate kinase